MKFKLIIRHTAGAALLFILFCMSSCRQEERSVKNVKSIIDAKISYLCRTLDSAELMSLNYDMILASFSDEEKEVLASGHWSFEVNVPVIVSVMRSTEQKVVPFWLTEKGFEKSEMVMKNEQTTYEVWQKPFGKGRVGLGINGLENYSLHYFVSVSPQKPDDRLFLRDFFPEDQYVGILGNGSFTYHDWDELVLSDVPDVMKGQKLLTTVRGRGVESHLAGAFRTTKFKSTNNPSQIMLTWSSYPQTGIDIQWRTDTTITEGVIRYRISGSGDEMKAKGWRNVVYDRVLMNDHTVNRYTAYLRGLEPGVKYQYLVSPQTEWDENQCFTTASADDSYTFIWFGDTHHSADFGKLINAADERHPGTAFYSIAGDIVSDGTHRNQWDDIFEYTKEVICKKPFMCVPGNHDNRAGLGAQMYQELFSYPINGPDEVPKEQTYSFRYKNTLFLMLDATSPIDAQTQWIEDQLKETDARWKFAFMHFPPYSSDGGYPEIRKELCSLFDKYHVDLVMSGHVHNYLRTKPMYGEVVVSKPDKGTIYLVSIGIPDNDPAKELAYADAQVSGEMLYQKIAISGDTLDYRAMNIDGTVRDQMMIIK